MKPILWLLLSVILLPGNLQAQIFPKENRTLNYRLISFSFPSKNDAVNYSIEIANGFYNTEDSFSNNVISTVIGKTNKIIAEVPSFGGQYTWRVVDKSGGANNERSELHHFSTGTVPEVDTNITRFRITIPASKFSDAYVFLDGNKVLYDMSGRPVWYLPVVDGKNLQVGDFKLTPQGTITFLANGRAYEVNYDGEILWKAPDTLIGASQPQLYHHEFTRLGNGHYMLLGTEFLSGSLPSATNGTFHINHDKQVMAGAPDSNTIRLRFGMIIEYDEQGKMVWSWKTSKYYEESDLIKRRQPDGHPICDLHENSFYFDDKDKVVYLSCKGISRIVKIKYPEGTVLNTYGESSDKNMPEMGNVLFCGQHSVSRSQKGCLFLFDNNGCGNGAPPKLKKLKEPVSKDEQMKIIWEYQCTAESDAPKAFPHGGSVFELSDQSLFACMGSDYSKTFIVDQDKKVLWSGIPEKWNEAVKTWVPIAQYRASIIENRKAMEQLAGNVEINNQHSRTYFCVTE